MRWGIALAVGVLIGFGGGYLVFDSSSGDKDDVSEVETAVVRHAVEEGARDADQANCRPRDYPSDSWSCDVLIGLRGDSVQDLVSYVVTGSNGDYAFRTR